MSFSTHSVGLTPFLVDKKYNTIISEERQQFFKVFHVFLISTLFYTFKTIILNKLTIFFYLNAKELFESFIIFIKGIGSEALQIALHKKKETIKVSKNLYN